jgi:hypothetical protein
MQSQVQERYLQIRLSCSHNIIFKSYFSLLYQTRHELHYMESVGSRRIGKIKLIAAKPIT